MTIAERGAEIPTAFDCASVVDYSRRSVSEPPLTQYELPGVA